MSAAIAVAATTESISTSMGLPLRIANRENRVVGAPERFNHHPNGIEVPVVLPGKPSIKTGARSVYPLSSESRNQACG
jgi:hypothetical protein